ncbi:hypothetical protein [Pseudofrankia asymbiotica]|uniref:Uncharacterized protein n=1 Tax=Pseudofrankia asymbiotica TaxID=1834516 RepID=A0A1V2HZS6_9ACTN|nr:hypothetical protein [Pseudofrankia asymbiotica]ONH22203.1 hypothetical protein BL253_36385 [Pseudofrankia asymbiotica]
MIIQEWDRVRSLKALTVTTPRLVGFRGTRQIFELCRRTRRKKTAPRSPPCPRRGSTCDRELLDAIAVGQHSLDAFVDIRPDLPRLTVDTSGGYHPGLEAITAFIAQPA